MPLYSIGGLKIWMEPRYEPLTSRSQKYRIEGGAEESDLRAVYTDEEWESAFARYKDAPHGSVEYMKTGARFYTAALALGCFYLHSSAVVCDGRAYLFSANSGVGKSTHTQNWLKRFGSGRAYLLNDDKPLIRLVNGVYYACGTPFSGKTDQSRNESVPLAGICFLSRGSVNEIARMDKGDVFPLLYEQTVRPPREDDMMKLLDMAEKLIEDVPFYRLTCTPEEESAEVSYAGMRPGC